ncbi:uncharacterized protein LOC107366301 [Tetranychus urticae]|uniref:C-type lectin domain-containing protein n=1 Tax=Tetranychus urticae TaxID=32264 RepID=T1KQ90_TETUR|nr:uncharacterized protein LOC107366301 [Tetranychus urticae]
MLHWPPSTITVFVITFVILKSSASSDKPSSLLCPPNWIYIAIADKCIKGGQVSGSNDDNLKYCNGLNASMITIESSEENDEIFKQFASLHIFRFWISGRTEGFKLNKKHQTKVDLMKSTDFSNWGLNSPHCTPGEQCCIMVNSFKQWQDYDCLEDFNFACEKRRIFESSELNQIVSAENLSPEEIECSGKVILEMMAPKNMSQLDDIYAKVNSQIEANHTISETNSVFSKPEASSPEPQPPKLNKYQPPAAASSLISQPAVLPPISSLSDSSLSASTSSPSISISPPSTSLPSASISPTSLPSTSSSPASSSSTLLLSTLPPLTESTSVSSPPVVTVSEELINHIIKRYQKNQLNVIRLWFDLIRTHRNSSERSRQFQRSIKDQGFQLSNYLLVLLTGLSILVLVATIITLLIITRRFLRQKTQDTYQMSSRLLELGYD